MAVITIDGKTVQALEDSNVLEAALQAGIYIPHLCYHPDLKVLGSCRLCIVEVEGEEGVTAACKLKPRDGMVIHTNSDRIGKLRNLAMELLLAGHPEECTTCPKYGNCELQVLIQYIGANNSRMRKRVKGFEPEERSPLILHDMNRCVLCGRCVRACSELRGVEVLDYRKEGLETYVGTLHQKLLADADCRFCGACVEVCPTGSIRDKLREDDETVSREDALVPCRAGCPAHIDIPRYIRFAKEGDLDAAAAVVREKAPFPKALGYICNHLCETKCKRGEINGPLSIRNIKRYASEHDMGRYWKGKGKQLPDSGKKIAVVGAGPAGLTAAYYLRKQGHDVTVLEAMTEPGGMMACGIPSYRLPREVIADEVKTVTGIGVKIRTGQRVTDPLALRDSYDAVLMAVGTHQGVRLPIEGNDLPGVLLNIDFLRKASFGEETGMGRRVAVLGGGNVAFDCARTAVRLGAEAVQLACLEAADQMPADEEEITAARGEGIRLHPGYSFEKILGSERAEGVLLQNVTSFSFDEAGRAVIEKGGEQLVLEADTVIFAVGQRCDLPDGSGLARGRGGSIAVKDATAQTEAEGIFAAGDAVYGTKSVIEAIHAGRQAASEIDRYLGGDGDISEVLAPQSKKEARIGKIEGFAAIPRSEPELEQLKEKQNPFALLDHGISGENIGCETGRCLQCDLRCDIRVPRKWSDLIGGEEALP